MLLKNLQVKQEVIFGIQWCFEAGEVVDIRQTTLQLAVIAAVKNMSCRRTPLVLLVPQGVDAWEHVKLKTVYLAPEGYVWILAYGRKILRATRKVV